MGEHGFDPTAFEAASSIELDGVALEAKDRGMYPNHNEIVIAE
ncbi:hypothetical protein [Streptomyces sp. NPDC048419]